MYIKEKNKGITLISLVIIVIVLLILAGVALTMLSGENGIMTRAKTAREQHKAGQELEENRLAGMENVMDEYLGNTAPGSTTGGSGSGSGTGGSGSGGTTPTPQTVTYTVIFNSNDGTETKETQIFIVGTPQNLRTNSFERSGYEFLGWNTDQNATTATYTNGVVINNENSLSNENGATVNLYAIWKRDSITAGQTATGTNKEYSDGTATAIIPKGWTVSGFTDEQTIANGLVIYDLGVASVTWTETNRATIQGSYNQFVWVPVSLAQDATSMPRYDGYGNGSKQTYVSKSNVTEPYASGYSTEASEYTAMINSVKANGGFYVGRYEASKNNSGIAESKRGKTPWVEIAWGSSMSSPGTSGAVAKAKAMYEGTSTTAKSSVTSTLIYGCQWDAIMNWIDPNFSTGNCVTTGSNKSVLVDSTGKGYYSQSSPTSTGSSTNYAMKNIYDMAGNVIEWTMEAYNTSYRVFRGGYYDFAGSNYPVSIRNLDTPSSTYDCRGFRATLYCNAES